MSRGLQNPNWKFQLLLVIFQGRVAVAFNDAQISAAEGAADRLQKCTFCILLPRIGHAGWLIY